MKNSVSLEEEYNRNPDLKREDILELQDWMRTEQPHLTTFTEYEMIQAHFASDFDKELTKLGIIVFYELRNEYKDILSNMDIASDELVQAYNTMSMVILPGTTPEGYRVGFWKFNDINPANFDCKACFKLLTMMFGCIMFEYGTCPGYILFLDFEGGGFRHLFSLQLRVIKLGIRFVQESLPIKIKYVEHYNFPIDRPLAIMRPFIGAELFDKLKFRKRLEQVYCNIPQEMFPSDYPGGKSPSLKELRETWWKKLNERRFQFLEAEKTYEIDESKRPIKADSKSWYNIF